MKLSVNFDPQTRHILIISLVGRNNINIVKSRKWLKASGASPFTDLWLLPVFCNRRKHSRIFDCYQYFCNRRKHTQFLQVVSRKVIYFYSYSMCLKSVCVIISIIYIIFISIIHSHRCYRCLFHLEVSCLHRWDRWHVFCREGVLQWWLQLLRRSAFPSQVICWQAVRKTSNSTPNENKIGLDCLVFNGTFNICNIVVVCLLTESLGLTSDHL